MEKIPIERLRPHPDNRKTTGVSEEKIEQLSHLIGQHGYDPSKPIKGRMRPDGHIEILEGEHRYRAAMMAGLEDLPVVLVDMDDTQAAMALITGNVQTEVHPLDIGRIALKICVKDSKKGLSQAAFYEAIGIHKNKGSRIYKAAEVCEHIEQCGTGATLLDVQLLYEISKCKKEDWAYVYEYALAQGLSKNDLIEVQKRLRALDQAGEKLITCVDLPALKKIAVGEKEKTFQSTLEALEAASGLLQKLPTSSTMYRYKVGDDDIEKYTFHPSNIFLSRLRADRADNPGLARHNVYKIYKSVMEEMQHGSLAAAEQKRKYYKDAAHQKEAEEIARAEWEAFMPVAGKWYPCGRHRLYCGDNTDAAFIDGLREMIGEGGAAFAFADPPYNAGVDTWDQGFVWGQDYLCDMAGIVAVTPGISSIPDLFNNTTMPYKWSMATWIKNGTARGALGFGNWIYTALFSKDESIHQNGQDVIRFDLSEDLNDITIKSREHGKTDHKGRKPSEYMKAMVEKFTKQGDIVIDPFAGSGSTLEACEAMNRTCYAAEISPVFCKDILNKLTKTEVYENAL